MEKYTCCLAQHNLGKPENLTAHKRKLLFIDGVLSFDNTEHTITTFSAIHENILLYDSQLNGLPSYSCFEYIAQSISVLFGIESKILHNKNPELGFILSVSNMICHETFVPNGMTLISEAKELNRDVNISQYTGACYATDKNNKRLILEAELLVMPHNSELIKHY